MKQNRNIEINDVFPRKRRIFKSLISNSDRCNTTCHLVYPFVLQAIKVCQNAVTCRNSSVYFVLNVFDLVSKRIPFHVLPLL